MRESINPDVPVISVIVPVFHVEKYLRRCLDSILGQTFRNFELILINDGGNADETAICEEYARRDGRIVYLFQENRGLSGARNTGLRMARGEWIMFVDSDDWVREDFCAKALDSVVSAGADIGIFDLVYTEGDATDGYVHSSALETGIYPGYEVLKRRLIGQIPVYAWNKIYRASLWEGLEFPVGEIWEDEAVIHVILDRARTAAVIHDVLYYKPGRDDSITANAAREKTDAYWLFVQRCRCYEYAEAHHRELLPLISTRTAGPLLKHAQICLLDKPDPQAIRDARTWAKTHRLRLRGSSAGLPTRLRFWAFLYLPPLYVAMERLWRVAAVWRQHDRKNFLPR